MTVEELAARHKAAIASMNPEQRWALDNIALVTNMICVDALSEDGPKLTADPYEALFAHIIAGTIGNLPPSLTN